MTFHKTLRPVIHGAHNSVAVPPTSFLTLLVEWARNAHDDIFALNKERYDILNSLWPELGPWIGEPGSKEWFIHRKAVVLEGMRVLGAFESDYRWNEGKDQSSHKENDDETKSAGLWQISYNSLHFGEDLVEMLQRWSVYNGAQFQVIMKLNPAFAMEYAARLFRHTTHHNGPLLRKKVNKQVSRESVSEFIQLLTNG